MESLHYNTRLHCCNSPGIFKITTTATLACRCYTTSSGVVTFKTGVAIIGEVIPYDWRTVHGGLPVVDNANVVE